MSPTLCLALALLTPQEGPLLRASETLSQSMVFLEATTPRARVFQGESLTLSLRIGVDEAFLRTRMIQPFRRELDLPVQVHVPWLLEGDSLRVLPADSVPEQTTSMSLALGEEVVRLARVQDLVTPERRFLVLELSREVVPLRPGELHLPPAEMVLAYTSAFREDVLRGRQAEDRVDARVAGTELSLEVLPLPESGRPAAFSGAVGRFDMQVAVDPPRVELGSSLELVVSLRGQGDLGRLTAPDFPELERFQVLGQSERPMSGGRQFVYDLAPRDEFVDSVPALAFVHFDPEPPGGYTSAHSPAVAIEVLPRTGALQPTPEAASEAPAAQQEAASAPEAPRENRSGRKLAIGVAVLTPLFIALVERRRRRRGSASTAPKAAALAAFLRELEDPEADPAQVFAQYLATRLECPAPAVIAPDLDRRLQQAGIPEQLAGRSAHWLELHVGARYGGRSLAQDAAGARQLAHELEAAFTASSSPPA